MVNVKTNSEFVTRILRSAKIMPFWQSYKECKKSYFKILPNNLKYWWFIQHFFLTEYIFLVKLKAHSSTATLDNHKILQRLRQNLFLSRSKKILQAWTLFFSWKVCSPCYFRLVEDCLCGSMIYHEQSQWSTSSIFIVLSGGCYLRALALLVLLEDLPCMASVIYKVCKLNNETDFLFTKVLFF